METRILKISEKIRADATLTGNIDILTCSHSNWCLEMDIIVSFGTNNSGIYNQLSILLGPIITLIAVYIGHILTIDREKQKRNNMGRIKIYSKFINQFKENSEGKPISPLDLLNCCIELEKYATPNIKRESELASKELVEKMINNLWADNFEEFKDTNKIIENLGKKVIPLMRTDLVNNVY